MFIPCNMETIFCAIQENILKLTDGVWHSGHHHEVIHSHCRNIVNLELLETLLQVTVEQIHKINQLGTTNGV